MKYHDHMTPAEQDQLTAELADIDTAYARQLDPLAPLILEFEGWCVAQGLKLMSADELALAPGVSADQAAWLNDFCERWDAAVTDESAELAKAALNRGQP